MIIVVHQLGNTPSAVDAVLRDIFPKALDHATFTIISSPIDDKEIVEDCLLVDQKVQGEQSSTANSLHSYPELRTIAVVDRTANVDLAARSIVTARFSFRGKSPYAPDIVLVNEFVKTEFYEACTCVTSQLFANQSNGFCMNEKQSKIGKDSSLNALQEILRLKKRRVIFQNSDQLTSYWWKFCKGW
jgi:hypothetical protein